MRAYIPVQLMQYVLEKKISKVFRSFVFLKYHSGNGIIKIDKSSCIELAQLLDINVRTFKRHLQALNDMGWIGFDDHERAFVRGWYQISLKIGRAFTSKVEFHSNYLVQTNWQGYIMGSIIGRFVLVKQFVQKREGQKNGCSLQAREQYFPFSCRLGSEIINISRSRINDLIIIAVGLKYIALKPGKLEATSADPKMINHLEKQWQSGEPFPVTIGGKVYLKYPNKYYPLLHYKKAKYQSGQKSDNN